MDHDTFRETFEARGFEVEKDYVPPDDAEGDLPTLVARSDDGDEIYWCILQKTEDWGIYIDPEGFTLDSPEFRWNEVDFEDETLVIENAYGTRSKASGYGVTGWDGEFRIHSHRGSTVTETHTY